ncbi:hypothetical protein [Bacillus sp. AFS031507]|uniref:hypothetical protein n=1 Tax=Bacillus sp. AFS031507 TaxID=2033496 RepID=UPI00211DE1B8|nr:hypothetical protein [Bacillus sp. AFS031507]
MKESINLSLDAVPEGIDTDKIKDYLSGLPTILEVHDLHIWGMSSTGVEFAFNRALLPVSSLRIIDFILGILKRRENFFSCHYYYAYSFNLNFCMVTRGF